MTNPAAGDDYTQNIPSAPGIHDEPAKRYQFTLPSQDQLGGMHDKLINMVLETITMAVQGFVNFGEDLFEQVANWAADVFGKASDAWNGLGDLIQRLLNDPIGVIGELPQMLIEGLEDALTDVGNWIDLIVDSILGVFGIGPGGDLLSRVQDMAAGFDGMLNDLDDQIANFGDLLSNLLTSPQSVLGFLPQSLITGLGDLAKFIFGGHVSGSNLVVDPSFANAAQWAGSQGAQSTEQKHSGTTSWKITTDGTAKYVFFNGDYRGLSVSSEEMLWKSAPGERFDFELWIYGPSSNHPVVGTPPRLRVACHDSTGVNAVSYVSVTTTSWTQFTAAAGTWFRLGGYMTVPAGRDRVRPYIEFSATETAGNVWYIDDVLIREVTEAQNIVERVFGGIGSLAATILDAIIPGLNASKIISGQFGQAMIAGLDQFVKFVFGGTSAGSNLVGDAGFEDLAEWPGTPGVMSTAQRRSGTNSRLLTSDGSSVFTIWFNRDNRNISNSSEAGMYKVQPGDKYYVECWVYAPAGNTFAGAVPDLRVRYQNSTTGAQTSPTLIAPTWAQYQAAANSWYKLSGYAVVPTGYDRMAPYFSVRADAAGNLWYVDDLMVREVTESQNIVQRIFGGVGATITTILDAIIPGLSAGKITSGQFGQQMIAGLETLGRFIFGGQSAGSNLVGDSGFENDEQWPSSRVPGVQSTEQKRSGTKSRKVTHSGANNYIYLNSDHRALAATDPEGAWKVQPGEKYYLEGWIYIPSTNTNTGTTPRVIAAFLDSKGVLPTSATQSTGATTWGPLNTNAWNQISGYVTVPAGYDRMIVRASTNGDNPSGNIYYWDDVIVREVTESQNIVQRVFGAIGSTVATILDTIIPGLNASKIISGQFAQDMIAGLGTALGNIWTEFGRILTGLLTNPVEFIGNLIASMIPGLPASKITSGQFAQDMIANLGTALDTLTGGLASKLSIAIFGGKVMSGSNLVVDTEFDTELWNVSGMMSGSVISTEQKRSGTKSIKVTGPSRNIYMISSQDGRKDLQVAPGEKFFADSWFYLPVANAATAGSFRIDAIVSDSTGTNALQAISLGSLANSAANEGSWKQLSSVTPAKGYFTVPAGYDRLNFRVTTHSSVPASDVVFIDDFIVREVTESQNIVEKIFGAVGSTVATILDAIIPGLNASKITSGQFAQTMVVNLVSGLQNIWDEFTRILTGLLTNPVAFIGNLLASMIPGLPTSKIISGQFGQSMVSGLENFVKQLFGIQNDRTNLVTDGGFENEAEWPAAFITGASVMSTEQKHSGTNSRKFVATSANQTIYLNSSSGATSGSGTTRANMWRVQPGEKYYAEGWVYVPAGNTFNVGSVPRINVALGDSTGVISATLFTNITPAAWTPFINAAPGWLKISGYYTVPAGYDRMAAYFQVYGSDTTGNVYYFDDAIVRDATESQNIVQRIFGAVGSTVATILDGIIPGLNASKIVSGQFAQDMINGLGTALGNIWTEFGRILNGLLTNPIDFIGNLLASMIPGLPTGKITSGQFAQTMITGLQDAFITVNDWIQDIIDGIESALRKIPIVGGTLANMVDALGDLIDFTDNTDVKATNANTKVDKTTANNMVTDPGFDTTLWIQGGGVTISTAQKRTGTKSMLMTGAGATRTAYLLNLNDSSAGREVPVSPDDKFYMEAWVWRPSGNDSTGTLVMGFQWLNAAGTASTTGTTVSFNQSTLATNAWVKITATLTMPSTAVAARPFAQMGSSMATGNLLYWDDVVVREATAAEAAKAAAALTDSKVVNSVSGNMVTDPGFENTALWTLSTGITLSTVQKRSGTRSLLMTAAAATRTLYYLNGNSSTAAQRIMAVSDGDRIQMKAWVFRPTGNSSTGNIVFNCVAIDAAGATTNVQTSFAQSSIPFDTWTEIGITLTMPATAVSARPVAQVSSSMPSGDLIYFDDIFMQNATLAVLAQAAAAAADAKAVTADGKAVVADGKAVAADGKAVTAQNTVNQLALDPENLLAGSDFEDANNFPWTVNSPTRIRDTDQQRAGAASYRFSGTPSGASYTGTPIAIRGGERLYAEVWVRKDANFNATDARLRLGNNGTINNNSFNLYFRPADINTAAAAQGVANINTWVKLSLVSNPFPADVTRLSPSIVMTSMTAGNLWIDDIVVRRVKESDAIPSLPQNKIDGLPTDLNTIDGKATTADGKAVAAVKGLASNVLGQDDDWLQPDANSAVKNLMATIADQSQSIADLQNDDTGSTNGGTQASVTFPTDGSIPASITATYSGAGNATLVILDQMLTLNPSTNGSDRVVDWIYNALQFTGDYQRGSMVFGNVPGTNAFNTDLSSSNRIKLRCNAAGTSYVYVELFRNRYDIGCVVSGVTTVWFTGSGSFKSGQLYSFEAGTAVGGLRQYRFFEGGTLIKVHTEVGTSSQIGASFRYIGGRANTYNATKSAARVRQIQIRDNAPPSYVGVSFRWNRTSTASVGHSSGQNAFANNFFDATPAINTGHFAPVAARNGGVVVSISGTYAFSVRVQMASNISANAGISAAVARNAVWEQFGGGTWGYTAFGASGGGADYGFSFLIYLQAGDTVQPGYNTGGGIPAAVGSSDGASTYMTLSLVNRSTR